MNKIILLTFCIFFVSCFPKNDYSDENLILHAAPQDASGPGLVFQLFNGNKYRVVNFGYIGGTSYLGTYSIKNDTITLNNLNYESTLESNRLLIFRYDKQDSGYWKWKYEDKLEYWKWEDLKKRDYWDATGDVYQLDMNNKPIKDAYHFLIRLDSLKND